MRVTDTAEVRVVNRTIYLTGAGWEAVVSDTPLGEGKVAEFWVGGPRVQIVVEAGQIAVAFLDVNTNEKLDQMVYRF